MSSIAVNKIQTVTVNISEITVESISLTVEFFFFLINQDTHATEMKVSLFI